jgi:hypothetical protein
MKLRCGHKIKLQDIEEHFLKCHIFWVHKSEKIDEPDVENYSIWTHTPLRDFGSKCIMNKHSVCCDSKCKCLCHPHNQQ